jgi:quinolinate synthase
MIGGIVEKINKLKRTKNAVILAHYYTVGEVREVADFTGDSLALSIEAARTDADVIVFAGVYFMAETAKILSPSKKVLIPDAEAGCSLAESCSADKFRVFRERYPEATVVSYVNTTAAIKALTDICCTSTNALDVINSIPADRQILFAPDRNLGSYLQKQAGRRNMILWDGSCHVHEQFSLEGILALKKQYPEAKVLAHPECKQPVLMVADFVGSTAAILNFCEKDDAREYIVVTESGILHDMRAKYPDRTFIPAPPLDSTCGCNDCEYMKLVTLEKILRCLETENPEVTVEEPVRAAAEKSIRAMLALK